MRKYSIVPILFSLILFGCSKLKFAVDMAPWLVERQVKKYVSDLRPEQKELLKAESKAYVEFIRTEMLPAYSEALLLLADSLATTGTSKAAELLAPIALNGLYSATLEPLYKPSGELLATLDEKQIKHLETALEKKLDEDAKLYLNEKVNPLEQRVKRLHKSLEDYFGELNEVQVRHLDTLCRNFPMPYEAWIRDRRERATKLCALLREKRPRAEVEAHLRDWWTKARSAGRKREDYQWDDRQLRAFVNGILNMMTPAQNLEASRVIRDYAAQLAALALPQPRPELKPTPAPAHSPTPAPVLSPSPSPAPPLQP